MEPTQTKLSESASSPGTVASTALPPRTSHLRLRILKWSLLVALVPMLLVAIQGYHCAREAVLEATTERLSQLAASQRTRIQMWLAERRADVEFLAQCPYVRYECGDPKVTTSEGEEALDFFRLFSVNYGIYDAIGLYDPSWQELAGIGTDVHGLSDFQLSGIPESLTSSTQPAVGRVHRHEDQSLGIHFGAAVLDGANRPVGYVLTALDSERSLQHLLRDGLGPSSPRRCYLVSTDGLILTEPAGRDDSTALAAHIATEGFQRGRAGKSGASVYSDYLGREVVGGFAAIPEMDWVLLIEQDATEALSWLSRLAWRAGITALLVALGVIILAFRAARRIAEPLQLLVGVAEQVAHGHHDTRAAPAAEPEVDAVGRALNHMLDELASARQRLISSATLAALGETSASVVHELRNPLSSIKLNLHALRSRLADDPRYDELARIAQEQAERLEYMLTDLLSLGRPLTLNFRPLPLKDAVAAAIDTVANRARERCRLRFQDDAPALRVKLDADRIGQALVNLLNNALDAIGDGGEIVVRTSLDSPSGNRAILEILDDGPGIPEDNLERLFQPFFTTRAQGTGLGLAIVRKIVEYHGGRISAANRTGPDGASIGAVFRIELPLHRESESAHR
tara:strand:+ start:23078 stop:24958 length:1881 start_codon:yes stop_codon:yes gene_type:complete